MHGLLFKRWAPAVGLLLLLLAGCGQTADDQPISVPALGPGDSPTVLSQPGADTVGQTATAAPPPTTTPPASTAEPSPTPTVLPVNDTVDKDAAVAFEPGATSAVVEGQIPAGMMHLYRVEALQGQTMTLQLTGDNAAVAVLPHGGLQPLNGGVGGVTTDRWESILPTSGRYVIQVMTTNGPADYALTISVSALNPGSAQVPPPAATINPAYERRRTDNYGPYTVELWSQVDGFPGDSTIRILRSGELVDVVDSGTTISELSGTDITGSGIPNLIVESYTGGAHCCFSTHVYELAQERPSKLLQTPPSNCGGRMRDLNEDGIYEYQTCDDSFAYLYCPYAASPAVPAVLRFDGVSYVPANLLYPQIYQSEIPFYEGMAQDPLATDFDGKNKCSVLPLVLSLLYAGDGEAAYQALMDTYTYPDRPLFWQEILNQVNRSPYYEPSGTVPAVNVPPGYALALTGPCVNVSNEVGVAFLSAPDQDVCAAETPTRDLFWLTAELTDLGLIERTDSLRPIPAECTAECEALEIFRYDEDAPRGRILLPDGYVQRELADGTLGARWRLTGVLTWEQVP